MNITSLSDRIITGDQMIRLMTQNELNEIYQNHMIHDFPDDERKPLSIIASRYKKNQNICLVYLENDVIMGYGIFEFCNHCLLMDYFAILPEFRNRGKGTQFLKEMKQYFNEWDALFVESECAFDEVSQRRLNFYQNSDFFLSGIQVHLYHVDYEVLVLPIKKEIHKNEIRSKMDEIYAKIYPKSFRMLFLKWK